jgi:RNA ligase
MNQQVNAKFFEERDNYVKEKYLSKSILDDLVIYNYTQKTMNEDHWDSITLTSRGSIYNQTTGSIVAIAWPKFFNLNEQESTRVDKLPWSEGFEVYEKLDGSLGVLYRHQGQLKISTRGSFYSPQSAVATEMLKKYDMHNVPDNVTLLFEIIYPENKIIINYNTLTELFVIGGFNLDTREELSRIQLENIAANCRLPIAKMYDMTFNDLMTFQKHPIFQNKEGFVVKFRNGQRVKIKANAYIDIMKVASGATPLNVWTYIVENTVDDYIQNIAEEIKESVVAIKTRILTQKQFLIDFANKKYKELGLENLEKKEAAAIVMNIKTPELQKLLFCIMNKKPMDLIVMNMIKPSDNRYVNEHEFVAEGPVEVKIENIAQRKVYFVSLKYGHSIEELIRRNIRISKSGTRPNGIVEAMVQLTDDQVRELESICSIIEPEHRVMHVSYG